MGLDMYLRKEKYLSAYRFQREQVEKDPERFKDLAKEIAMFDKMVDLIGMKPTEDSPSFQIQATVCYWRKANAIHAYFVREHANGVDKCQPIEVEAEDLRVLMYKAKLAKSYAEKSKSIPTDTLPPESGFFFGPTDNLEWYLENMQETIDQLEPLVSVPDADDYTYVYQASW